MLNATTKAGSTSYHGEAYLYARDTALNSNDWYNNYLQQTRPPGPFYYPGGQFGGPLRIPRTRFGPHNKKLFFFVGYEYYNQNYLVRRHLAHGFQPWPSVRATSARSR